MPKKPTFVVRGECDGIAWTAEWYESYKAPARHSEARLGGWILKTEGKEQLLQTQYEWMGREDEAYWRRVLLPDVRRVLSQRR
jgi:hypothetical protein